MTKQEKRQLYPRLENWFVLEVDIDEGHDVHTRVICQEIEIEDQYYEPPAYESPFRLRYYFKTEREALDFEWYK